MFSGIGSTEIIIVAIVLLVLFGGKKLPELARGLSDSIKEFRKAYEAPDSDKKSKKDKESD